MLRHFLTKSKHLMTLKIKDKKLFGRNRIFDNFIWRENLNYRGLFVDTGSGSDIFPDPGDPKRPDPTGSGSATLVKKRRIQLLLLSWGFENKNYFSSVFLHCNVLIYTSVASLMFIFTLGKYLNYTRSRHGDLT